MSEFTRQLQARQDAELLIHVIHHRERVSFEDAKRAVLGVEYRTGSVDRWNRCRHALNDVCAELELAIDTDESEQIWRALTSPADAVLAISRHFRRQLADTHGFYKRITGVHKLVPNGVKELEILVHRLEAGKLEYEIMTARDEA